MNHIGIELSGSKGRPGRRALQHMPEQTQSSVPVTVTIVIGWQSGGRVQEQSASVIVIVAAKIEHIEQRPCSIIS